MKKLFHQPSGIARIFLSLAITWFVLANYLYFTGLGTTYFVSFSTNAISPDLPGWQDLWRTATSGSEAIRLYERMAGASSSGSFPYKTAYRFSGHALFVGMPIVFGFVLYSLGKWVGDGFGLNDNRDESSE